MSSPKAPYVALAALVAATLSVGGRARADAFAAYLAGDCTAAEAAAAAEIAASAPAGATAPSARAYYVAAACRREAGFPSEALELGLRGARGAAPTDRALLALELGRTLEALGRYAAAERIYLRAASTPSLSGRALCGAARVARAAGAPARASRHLRAARRRGATVTLQRRWDAADGPTLPRPPRAPSEAAAPGPSPQTAAPPPAAPTRATLAAATPATPPVTPAPPVAAASPATPAPPAPAAASARSSSAVAFAAGSRAWREGRHAEAAEHFERASRLDPDDGEALVMAALARSKAGQPEQAAQHFRAALRRPLSQDDRALAEVSLLDTATTTPSESAWWGMALLGAGGGFDSNVAHSNRTGIEDLDRGDDLTGVGAGFLSASLLLGGGRSFGKTTSAETLYTFFQTAYLEPRFDDFAGQEHGLEAALRLRLHSAVRLMIAARGDLSFVGLRERFAPFLFMGGGQARLNVDETSWTRTTLGVYVGHKRALDPEFDYLGGVRLDAEGAQELRAGGFSAEVGLRLRRERVGVSVWDAGAMSSSAARCPGCAVDAYTPFSYDSASLSLRVSTPSSKAVRLVFRGRAETRPYSDDNHLVARAPVGRGQVFQVWTRHDRRLAAGGELVIRLHRRAEVALRYDFLASRSNVDASAAGRCLSSPTPCHPLAYANRNFDKHLVGAELTLGFN